MITYDEYGKPLYYIRKNRYLKTERSWRKMSMIASGKGVAALLLALLLGTGLGAFIISPVVYAGQQQQQTLILTMALQGVQVSGTISISGSTTVLPITEAMIQPFSQKYPLITVQAGGGGSGEGFASVIEGRSPIGAVSRPPKATEVERANSAGVKLVGWVIGLDAICVIYNNPNVPQLNLTRSQIKSIFERAGTANPPKWSEFGLQPPPNGDDVIRVFIRESGSGTRGEFEEYFGIKRTDWTGVEVKDGNPAMLTAVANNQGYFGYVSIAYYLKGGVRVQAVNVAYNESYDYYPPSVESIVMWARSWAENPTPRPEQLGYTGKGYFACRFIYYVTNGYPSPGSLVDKYLSFVLSREGQTVIRSVGYVSLLDVGFIPMPFEWN